MLTSILFSLLLETIRPSYGTFTSFMPASVLAAEEVPALADEKAPEKRGESIGPVVNAKAVFSIDLPTGTPLFTHNIFERRPLASIAKLVTAMVILDHHSLDEKVTVSRRATTQEGSKMFLAPGEVINISSLLTGLLVASGNDAAVALAEFNAGSEAAFVAKMNEKAAELGLANTHFSNAKGFDEKDNYSTAFDIMRFSRAALSYSFIRQTVSQKNAEVYSVNGRMKHMLTSTNELLENQHFQVVGLKTGSTPQAGESFVSLAKAPNGHEVLTVMLDSPDRFLETKVVIDWVMRNFEF